MHSVLTFVPSVKLVKQTMLQTSSCQIKVQKSAIVFGLGPFEDKTDNNFKNKRIIKNSNAKTIIETIDFYIGYPGWQCMSAFPSYPINTHKKGL